MPQVLCPNLSIHFLPIRCHRRGHFQEVLSHSDFRRCCSTAFRFRSPFVLHWEFLFPQCASDYQNHFLWPVLELQVCCLGKAQQEAVFPVATLLRGHLANSELFHLANLQLIRTPLAEDAMLSLFQLLPEEYVAAQRPERTHQDSK